jgi:hypothetical protein
MTQVFGHHPDLGTVIIRHRERDDSVRRRDQGADPAYLDRADIADTAVVITLSIGGSTVSHRHASQHTHVQKQGDTSQLVRSTGKPAPLFYELVLAAAGCPVGQVLFVGDNFACDVAGPVAHGMRAALVRPDGLRPEEELPDGALLISHVQDLPQLLRTT